MEFKCDECKVKFNPKKSDIKEKTIEEEEDINWSKQTNGIIEKIYKNTYLTLECPLCGSINYIRKIESVFIKNKND